MCMYVCVYICIYIYILYNIYIYTYLILICACVCVFIECLQLLTYLNIISLFQQWILTILSAFPQLSIPMAWLSAPCRRSNEGSDRGSHRDLQKKRGILGDFWHEFSHCRKKTGVLRMKIATYPSQVSRLPPLGVDRVGSPRDLEVTYSSERRNNRKRH